MTTATHIGLFAGLLTSIAVVPQVVRTWRTKHAKDLSIWQPMLLVAGMLLWLIYGIMISDTPLIAANTFSLLCYFLLIGMKIVYDRKS
ncbi:MAG TPA: SemiSWEET transporter [Geobacteraceae bacterium]|nr:SemiSWEET transporter [Geobacteraceae bacterium]